MHGQNILLPSRANSSTSPIRDERAESSHFAVHIFKGVSRGYRPCSRSVTFRTNQLTDHPAPRVQKVQSNWDDSARSSLIRLVELFAELGINIF
jgi:hypothetical protein